MNAALKICIGLAIIFAQTLIGARAFFPDTFETAEDPLLDLLESKPTVLDRASPEDLVYLSHHQQVLVGVDPSFYPLEMFDERGRYTGLGGDYMRLLAKMTGLTFKPIALADWAATEEKARAGGVDIFMAAAKTGRRAEYMLFTSPYITMPGIIMTLRGKGLDEADMDTLKGKKVAVTKNYSWHDFLEEFHPEIEAVPAASTLDALQKVVTGEADAVLDYEFNLLEKIQTAGILQMQTAGKVDSAYGHAIAVRKDRPELFNVLNMALSQISPREQKQLAEKWLERERPNDTEKRLQWFFFFLVESLLLCLGLNWLIDQNIRKQVRARLKEARSSERQPAA